MKSITLVGQNFTKRVGRVKLPYIDQVVGYYLFGANAASSLPNLAYGASQNLAEISTPTYGAGYAEITSTKGFDTGLLLDTPFTQIVVAQHTVATTAMAMYGRGSANGDNFVDMLRFNNTNGQIDGWPDGTQQQAMNVVDVTSFRLMAQTWGGTGTRHCLYTLEGTNLITSMSSVNVAKTTTPTHTLKFGTGYVSGAPVMRVATGVLAAKVLTPQQIYEMGIYLRALLATRGITML